MPGFPPTLEALRYLSIIPYAERCSCSIDLLHLLQTGTCAIEKSLVRIWPLFPPSDYAPWHIP